MRPGSGLVFQAAIFDPQAPNGLAVTPLIGGAYASAPTYQRLTPTSVTVALMGYSLATADLDGDGADELIAGALEDNAPTQIDAGRVFIYSGLPAVLTQTLNDPSPEAFGRFGVSVATGDLNGDGFLDIVVGSRTADLAGPVDSGKSVVFFGPTFATSHILLPPVPEAGGRFGHFAALGDFDGDGFEDVAVTSIGASVSGFPAAGAVDIFYGPSLAHGLRIPNPVPGLNDQFGYRIAAADLDGDSMDDLVVAAPFKPLMPSYICGTGGVEPDDSGALYVLRAPFMTLQVYFPNPQPSCFGLLGADLSVKDLNLDGHPDIIAGAEFDSSGGVADQGSVYILEGPTFGTVRQIYSPTPTANAGFGGGVDVGDFNNDQIPDLCVGEFYYTGTRVRQGRAFVLLGPDLLQSIVLLEPTPGTDFQFGRRVRVGDLDGDGESEVIIGAPLSSASSFSRAGAVYVIDG
jgi:hypothetical protein